MNRKFQMWFYLLIGLPYFIYAFLKICGYLIDVLFYKTDVLDAKGLVYVVIQLLFMAAAGFVIKLGINEIRVKNKNNREVTKK